MIKQTRHSIYFVIIYLLISQAFAQIGTNIHIFRMNFPFTYADDITNLPLQLKQYDPRLIIEPSLGKVIHTRINLDLDNATLIDIANAVEAQSDGKVKLLYSQKEYSVRLSFANNLDVGTDAVKESLRWQNGGLPRPVLQKDGVVRFPYGEYQPVITCQPLNLCDIELQQGEQIQGVLIGDSVRWNSGDGQIPIVYSGSGPATTPHLVLKPSQSGLSSTLMITTSKRTYMIKLQSSEHGYVVRSGFYYPKAIIDKFELNKSMLRNNTITHSSSGTIADQSIPEPLVKLSKVNYNYTITGKNYNWKPTHVFDDGAHIYIQMPPKVTASDLPGICVLVNDSNTDCELVNFRYNHNFYIVDKLFTKARLINGDNRNSPQEVTISRGDSTGFWERLWD